MADITEAIEQDAIADTLVAPLHSISDQATEGSVNDGAEYAMDESSDESQEVAPEATDDTLQSTPEQREQYTQEMAAWEALPEQQQAQIADEHLQSAYGNAYASITPAEAEQFTNTIGENWGVQDLASKVDPVPFATFADVWSDNAQRTIALHPSGPDFLEALSDEQHPERALELAASMCDATMVQRFCQHFANILGREHFARRDPMQFAAECMVDLGRLQGWGQRQQQEGEGEESVGRASPSFRTNGDLFDDATLDAFRRL